MTAGFDSTIGELPVSNSRVGRAVRALRLFCLSRLVPLSIAATILASFLAGMAFASFAFARSASPRPEDRLFQLMIYHARPGKAVALASVFRSVSELQAKHKLDVIGYWLPNGDPAWRDTFIYLIVHPDRVAADAHWKELHADPAFLPYRNAAAPLIAQANGDYRVDEVYMRPTAYSALK